MRSVLALLVLVCVACGKNTEPPPPSSGSPSSPPESGPGRRRGQTAAGGAINEQAKQMFASVCANCHGIDGTGNGPAAEMINPKPRNYTDAAWQASVTDEQLKLTILKGGQATGKSGAMPGNPQLEGQPEVLAGLVQIIRGFKK